MFCEPPLLAVPKGSRYPARAADRPIGSQAPSAFSARFPVVNPKDAEGPRACPSPLHISFSPSTRGFYTLVALLSPLTIRSLP
jgi:hypothetical protein